MALSPLADELQNDPVGIGYPVDDQAAHDKLRSKTTGREINRDFIDPWDLYVRFNKGEYHAIVDVTKIMVLTNIFRMREIKPTGKLLKDIEFVFGDPSETSKNFIGHAQGLYPGDDLRKEKVSRKRELADQGILLGRVTVGDITNARAETP